MDLNRLRQLSGQRPLYESVQAVPGIGSFQRGDKVNPRWSQNGEPMEVVNVLPSGKAIVVDEFGNKGTIPVDDLVPAGAVAEEFSVDDIDAAQNDIDLDQGSQFTEAAQVVSCNQDNPASVVDACAMDTSTVVNESGELISNAVEDLRYYIVRDRMNSQEAFDRVVAELTHKGVDHLKAVRIVEIALERMDDGMIDEAYDMQNGYKDIKVADGQDYFPNGADGPVVDKVGPSGAKQGDNPEQKKMEVTETHKELVYNYRKFLKEATRVDELSKDTLKSYAKKRSADVRADKRDADRSRDQGKYAAGIGDPKSAAGWNNDADQLDKRAEKHAGNVAKAVTKVARKESAQLNELSKDTLNSYAKKKGSEIRADKVDADRSREQGKYAARVGDPKSAAGWNDDADQLDKRAEKGAGNVAKAVIKVAKKT